VSASSRWPKLPSTWKVAQLKRVASLRAGEAIASETVAPSGDYPVFGGNGVRGYAASYTHDGTFALVGRQGALCGNVNYATGRFWASEHAVVVTPLKGNDVFWLGELLRSMNLNQYSQSAAQPGLSVELVEQLDIPVPPLPTQRAIADYLDRETALIDALIAAKQRMVELLEAEFRWKQITILTGDSYDSQQGHPMFGGLPSHWSSRRAKFCTGGITVGVVVNPSTYFANDGIPFVHGTDVREGFIETVDRKMLSAESNKILAKSQLQADDVVAMRVGYPGRAAVVPQALDGANCASVLIFRRSAELRPELICEFLNSPLGRAQIEAVQYGAAQEVMNVSDAVDLCLPIPPAAEQARLATQLVAARTRWQKMRALLDRSVTLLQERRQALITAAVTGQLDIRETA
jgi:type I restriction enzyme, S subunit